MAIYEGEIVSLRGADGSSFRGIRRDYTLIETEKPQQRETVFRSLGEYAIYQPHTGPWQLLPEERWPEVQQFGNDNYSGQWATAEDLRTAAGKGTFLPEDMDLIDTTLFHDQRKTCDATRLTVASEDDLRALLAAHNVSTDPWTASVRRLYNDIKPGESTDERENISLHLVEDALWLSTAQTMVNVYHTDGDGQIYKLQETDIIYYDENEKPRVTKTSKMQSSLGETGHMTGNRPERPFATAQRGLREELGLEDNDIASLVSLDSLLRINQDGHYRFAPINAEDRTHYFIAHLKPHAVHPMYINEERDSRGKLTARIKLEWFIPRPTS